jgi:hypothetical protein
VNKYVLVYRPALNVYNIRAAAFAQGGSRLDGGVWRQGAAAANGSVSMDMARQIKYGSRREGRMILSIQY